MSFDGLSDGHLMHVLAGGHGCMRHVGLMQLAPA